jgi:type IV secretory pathway VirB9-like protein
MRTSLPVIALLALAGSLVGCSSSEPKYLAMVEQPETPTEEDTSGVVEPWDNPIKVTPGEPAPYQTVTALLQSQNDAAVRDARTGAWRGAKLIYRWVDGEIYNVVATKNRITTLKLFPGEGFVNYSYGYEYFGPEVKATWSGTRDAKAMSFGPAQTSIPITPWVSGKCTDLTIYTTWREIFINICSTGTIKAYNRSVEWWMPGEELRRFSNAVKSGQIAAPTVEPATGIPHAEVNAKYTVHGQAPGGWSAKEWVAFNDGRKTYVVPPVGLPFDPVPTIRNSGTGETPSFRKKQRLDLEGSFYQIDALPPEIVMVNGDETLSLRRLP